MAKDSKTILLFTEQRDAIGYLTDEEAGQMFKAIYDYADEGIVPQQKIFWSPSVQTDNCRYATIPRIAISATHRHWLR